MDAIPDYQQSSCQMPTKILQDGPTYYSDPSEMDTPAFEFKRASQIRDRAKQLAMEHASREKLRDAAKPPLHRHRIWNPGQWVLVWRIAVGGERSRWVGPGLVILQNGHTVYVAMRSRLWKCNSDQLRPATPTEELGMQVLSSEQYRDLLQQMQSQRTGAVDVAREGSPGEDAWRTPMRNPEERETIRSIVPEEVQRASGEERESGARDGPAARGTGSGHLLRGLGEQSGDRMNNQQGAIRESRRASLDTVSERCSEPQGEAASNRSEDGDFKRRRLDELQPIAEGNEAEATSAETNAGAATSSATAASSAPVPEQASVSQRVQEIEERPHMRRRSRSPVPEVISRQLRLQERQPPPNSLSLVNWQLLDPNFNWDAQDSGLTAEQVRWKKAYKEDCIFYNNMINEAEEATAARGEAQETSNFFALGVAENDASGEVWAVEPARNGEITWKEMTQNEVKDFQQADLKEWESLEKEFKAVKVWRGEEARVLRDKYHDRIMSSRMVRRKKPMPGLHQYKAKSRFCVHGHKDPDSGTFRTFAPTPSTEALNLICQVIANLELLVKFADVKAAFAQSNRLRRPRGRLFVAPCEGVPLDQQDLIELIAPVYGLDDAPLRWFETVVEFLKSIGFRRSLLDPCVHVKHAEDGTVLAMILIEVDDFLIAAKDEEVHASLQGALQKRFHFGKWEVREADFIGRRIKQEKGEIRMDQEKYILEKLEAISLSRSRRAEKEAPLEEEEFKQFRSMLYKVSWVAHQTRPEAAGAVSILSSRLHKANVEDIILLNKMVGYLRSSSSQGLRIRKFDPREMTFIGVSDAGGVDGDFRGLGKDGLPEDPVQGAWLVLTSNLLPAHDLKVKVSVLSWRSSKLKRRVTSTMAGETMSLSQCLGELEWLQIF